MDMTSYFRSVGDQILTKFGSLMQNNMRIRAKWWRSKPEAEFQSGRRLLFKNGSSYIPAVNSSSRMRVMNHNWSATKQRLYPQILAEISRHSVLSGDRIRQCGTSYGSATWSQVLRPFRKPAWSGLSKPSTVGEMRWSARRSMSLLHTFSSEIGR